MYFRQSRKSNKNNLIHLIKDNLLVLKHDKTNIVRNNNLNFSIFLLLFVLNIF